jgi:N-acyl-D-amino-acid deacylase
MADLIIRGGTIYDGSGSEPFVGDVVVTSDTIAAITSGRSDEPATTEIDAHGLAVAPGFINMLSWSVHSLIEDGRSQSEIRQGVTLEVMGEGSSMGPLSPAMKKDGADSFIQQGHIKYAVEWTTLGEYLEWLERRGVSTNITSFVGTGTLRVYAMGYEDRKPTPDELQLMSDLVRQAMEEGAVGLSAALIYPPASYADTEEIAALARIVAEYDGLYISHIRSEGGAFFQALDELISIARDTGVRSEIYHLKAAGQPNWHKMDGAIAKIEQARAEGLHITADMYTYPFSGTGLSSCIPPWAHEGGHSALIARLKNPETRERIKREMLTPTDTWENMYSENGPQKILLAGFKTEALKPLSGKTLGEVAAMRGTSAEDTLMDLIVEDDSRIFTMYFSMSEDNLRKQVALPWVSFCSDAESLAPEGVFLQYRPHPRAYGSFARVIGKYVRDEGIISLQEAVRRLTSFPAANLKIEKRGSLKAGYFADVVIFDPARVQDFSTPQNPHQYSVGMQHVLVNGVQVLKDGEHTGAKSGRVVRGPGYRK